MTMLSMARGFAAKPDDWPLAPRFDPRKRWYHKLSEAREVWLLTWLPGQQTEWHDHGGSAGAFVVASGDLVEHTFSSAKVFAQTTHRAGAGRDFGPHHVHKLVNAGSRPAVSVHVYGPALTSMTRYQLDGGAGKAIAAQRKGALLVDIRPAAQRAANGEIPGALVIERNVLSGASIRARKPAFLSPIATTWTSSFSARRDTPRRWQRPRYRSSGWSRPPISTAASPPGDSRGCPPRDHIA